MNFGPVPQNSHQLRSLGGAVGADGTNPAPDGYQPVSFGARTETPVRVKPSVGPLARLARRQHGLFTADQAVANGVTGEVLRNLIHAGWCARLGDRIYRVEAAPRTKEQALLAATLVHTRAAASHRASADHWGVPGYGGAAPEVTVEHGRNRRTKLGLIHGSLRLPDRHVTVRRSVPVTTIARTIFDLAGIEPREKVGKALDYATSRKLCTLRQVNQVFFALAGQGRRGTVTMRALLEERGEGYVPPATELERVGRKVFREGGVPDPEFEVHLGDDDLIGRVDCYWREARLVVELDGARYHDGLSARESDRQRDNRLMAAGWRVLRFTWDDLTLRPTETIRTIRAALDARS